MVRSHSIMVLIEFFKLCYTTQPCHGNNLGQSLFLAYCPVALTSPSSPDLSRCLHMQWSQLKFVLSFMKKTRIFGEIFKRFITSIKYLLSSPSPNPLGQSQTQSNPVLRPNKVLRGLGLTLKSYGPPTPPHHPTPPPTF